VLLQSIAPLCQAATASVFDASDGAGPAPICLPSGLIAQVPDDDEPDSEPSDSLANCPVCQVRVQSHDLLPIAANTPSLPWADPSMVRWSALDPGPAARPTSTRHPPRAPPSLA
jgi:hypothetical protein